MMQERLQAYFTAQGYSGIQVSVPEPLTRGWETDVYAVTAAGGGYRGPHELVLRLYAGTSAGERPAAEAAALAHLGGHGYPVPKLVAFEADDRLLGGAFLVMERVMGELLWKRTPGPEQFDQLAGLMHRLHQVDARAISLPAPSTFGLHLLRRLFAEAGLGEAMDPVMTRLEQWEPSVGREARCLIHGDLHSDNVLVTASGAPYVIDWSCAVLDDPRVDVAQSVALILTNGRPEGAPLLVAAYEAAAGHQLAHMDYFTLLCLARRLGTVMVVLVGAGHLLGLRPGLDAELRPSAGRIRELVGLLEGMAGVALPGLYTVLDAYR